MFKRDLTPLQREIAQQIEDQMDYLAHLDLFPDRVPPGTNAADEAIRVQHAIVKLRADYRAAAASPRMGSLHCLAESQEAS